MRGGAAGALGQWPGASETPCRYPPRVRGWSPPSETDPFPGYHDGRRRDGRDGLGRGAGVARVIVQSDLPEDGLAVLGDGARGDEGAGRDEGALAEAVGGEAGVEFGADGPGYGEGAGPVRFGGGHGFFVSGREVCL